MPCLPVGEIVLVLNRTSLNKSGNVLQVVGSTLGLIVGRPVFSNLKYQLRILSMVITLSGTPSTGHSWCYHNGGGDICWQR